MAMLRIVLAFLVVQVAMADQGRPLVAARFFKTTTSVRYVVPTVTSTMTVAATCYSAVDVTGECRRRRHLAKEDPILLDGDGEVVDIDILLPTPVRQRAETTPLAEFVVDEMKAPVHLESSQDNRKFTFLAPDWFNMSRKLIGKPGFGVTFVNLETSTLPFTDLYTVTSGSSFFIVSKCLPSNFPYSECDVPTVSASVRASVI